MSCQLNNLKLTGTLKMFQHKILLTGILLVSCGFAGCWKQKPSPESAPRPVTVVTLEEADPTRGLMLTGTTEAWAQQDVGFDVAGRLVFVEEEGEYLKSRWTEEGKVIHEGDILAMIDPTDYEVALQSAQAELQQARTNADTLAPAQLKAAKAQLILEEKSLEKIKEAFKSRAATQTEVDVAQASCDVAKANVEQMDASVSIAKATVLGAQAHVAKAALDLRHTTLKIPFNAQVADTTVRIGGFVTPGQPVVKIVAMNPVKIIVTVSAKTDRSIAVGDKVDILIPGQPAALSGRVSQKSTLADPATRTFAITIIVGNDRVPIRPLTDPTIGKLPKLSEIMEVIAIPPVTGKTLFIEEKRCLRQENGIYHVWALDRVGDNVSQDDSHPVFNVRKIKVTPGAKRHNLHGIYIFRELKDAGGLSKGAALACNLPDGVKDGDRVVLLQEDWLLRPGALVRVRFRERKPQPGFYVPMQAIMHLDDNNGFVFVVERKDQSVKVRKVNVNILNSTGELVRIEGTKDKLITGVEVVLDGVNYLRDGETVAVVSSQGE